MNTKVIKPQTKKKAVNSSNGNLSNGTLSGKIGKKVNEALKEIPARAELNNKIKLAKERAQNTIQLGFEKAVAHFENPSLYPLPTDSKSVERAFYNFMVSLPNTKRNKLVDKINETLKASSGARANRYKDIVNVNFKSAVPMAQQVKAMAVPEELNFSEEDGNEMTAEFIRKADKPKKTGYATSTKPQPQQATATATKISFLLDNMTCLNPDDVRKDEINLAGFAIDSFGKNLEINPFFVGKFKKGDSLPLNGRKLFTFNVDPDSIAQTFVAGLFIIESDLISNDDLVAKLTILLFAIGAALVLVAAGILIAGLLGAAVTVTALVIALFSGLFFQGIARFIPLLGDDISIAVTDTLAINGTLLVDDTFNRTLTIGKGFDINSTFDGKYTSAARWVGEL